MNFDRLRFVAERAQLGEEKEAMIAVEIKEEPGSLKKLCEILGNRSLTEFSYRMGESSTAEIFLGVEVKDAKDRELLINKFKESRIPCLDLSKNELAKVHIRHMVGGRLPYTKNITNKNYKELLYRFEFPETPGALMKFVDTLKAQWSISIFHYRNHGADIGRIVIGVLVPNSEIKDWEFFLKELGYPSWDETENPAYKLFLGANKA